MRVIWLNGTVGSGKTAVGRALAAMLPDAAFVDGDDHAGSSHLPRCQRWHVAMTALAKLIARTGRWRTLVVAYPLTMADHARVRTICGRGHRPLNVVTLATPLALVVRGRGTRRLDAAEIARARAMWSEGYAQWPFATLTLSNSVSSPRSTACRIAKHLRLGARAGAHHQTSAARTCPRLRGHPAGVAGPERASCQA